MNTNMGSESIFLACQNRAAADEFTTLLEGVYEHSPWIADRAAAARP